MVCPEDAPTCFLFPKLCVELGMVVCTCQLACRRPRQEDLCECRSSMNDTDGPVWESPLTAGAHCV